MKLPFAFFEQCSISRFGRLALIVASGLLGVSSGMSVQFNVPPQYRASSDDGAVAGEIELLKREEAVYALVLTLRNTSATNDVVVRIDNRQRNAIFSSISINKDGWKDLTPERKSSPTHEWRSSIDVRIMKSGVRQWYVPLAELVDNQKRFKGKRPGRLFVSFLFRVSPIDNTGTMSNFKSASLTFKDYDVTLSGEDIAKTDTQPPSPDMLRFIDRSVIETNVVEQLRQTVAPTSLQFVGLTLSDTFTGKTDVEKRLGEISEFLKTEVGNAAEYLGDPDIRVEEYKNQFGATAQVSDGLFFVGITFHSASGPVASIEKHERTPSRKAPQNLEVGPDGKLVLSKITQAELPKPRTIYRIEFSKTGKLKTLNIYGETDESVTVREDNSIQAYSRKSKGGEVFAIEVDSSGHVQTRGIWPAAK